MNCCVQAPPFSSGTPIACLVSPPSRAERAPPYVYRTHARTRIAYGEFFVYEPRPFRRRRHGRRRPHRHRRRNRARRNPRLPHRRRSSSPPGPIFSTPDTNAADAQYCRSTGGAVERRVPEFNTNGGTPLILSGSANFCVYTSGGKYPSEYSSPTLDPQRNEADACSAGVLQSPEIDVHRRRQPGFVLLLATWRHRRVRRHQSQRRRMGRKEERRRPPTRRLHFPRPLLDRFVRTVLQVRQHHPRHQPGKSPKIQKPL